MPVEVLQVLRRNPVLQDRLTASLLDKVAIHERLLDLEARHVADAARLHVPITGDLGRVLLVQHRVQDWLIYSRAALAVTTGTRISAVLREDRIWDLRHQYTSYDA